MLGAIQKVDADPHRLWRYQPEELIPEDQRPFANHGQFYGSPTGEEVFAAYQGKVARLKPADGEVIDVVDTSKTGLYFSSGFQTLTPDGQAFIQADDDYIQRVNAHTGKREWKYPNRFKDDDMFSRRPPSVAEDGTVYVGTTRGKVLAIQPDGKKKWQVHTGSFYGAVPSLSPDGRLYVTIMGESKPTPVIVLDPDNGGKLDDIPLKNNPHSPVFPGPNHDLYIEEWDRDIVAVDPKTRTERWGYNAPKKRDQALGPTPGPDGLYVATRKGTIACLDPQNGKELWSFQTGEEIDTAPQIGPRGEIYVRNHDGEVVAFARDKAAYLAASIAAAATPGLQGGVLGVVGKRLFVGGVAVRVRS